MYLTFRRAQPDDFEQGFRIVAARHGYNDSLRKDMIKIWATLLENGHEPMAVVEDRDQPEGQRIVAFGTSFFAYDWFIQEAKTTLPPQLDLRVLEKWKVGKRPFLLKEEIIDEQLRGGVNAVSFNWGWDIQRYGPEESHKIGMTQSQSFVAIVACYRLKEFMQEVRGEIERDIILNMGIDLVRDYKEFTGTGLLPTNSHHPYLLGCNMEEVRKNKGKAGTPIDRQARLGPPRYGFQLSEQEVLKRALLGETDEDIANSLHLTLVTVKRRWQSIYAKVTTLDAGFLGEETDAAAAENDGAKQRRRFLLKSLSVHPEELWPNPPLKPNGSSKKS